MRTASAADPDRGDVAALIALHREATSFYVSQLEAQTPAARQARAILAFRCVPDAAVETYQLGYAPAGWTGLIDYLRTRGYSEDQLLAAGSR